MIVAIANGLIGLALSLGVGILFLNLDWAAVLSSVGAANLAALVSLLMTLRAEKIRWLLTHFLNRSLKTWSFLAMIYFFILLSLSPILRDLAVLKWMIVPLILSNGFAIVVFGPIQDQIVRREQRKSRST